MTGNLVLNCRNDDRFTRIVFRFDCDDELVFSDRRRLGRVWLIKSEKEIEDKLGVEPLTSDFTSSVLLKKVNGRQAPVKAVLLEQALIAGIGNMYADEALFVARIHPLKKASDLSTSEIKRLHKAIIHVLQVAVNHKGASVDTYKRPGGERGTAHTYFQVAHRRGEICPRCQKSIERIAVRNRGTYFCPECQRF